MTRQGLYLAAALCALTATAAGVRLVAREYGKPEEARNFVAAESRQRAGESSPAAPYPFRVLPSRLTPRLRVPFEALGDRLHRPGKERLTLSGTLTREGGTRPVLALYEFPHMLEVASANSPLLSFDEREAMRGARVSGGEAEALVETLFYDSAEHFFFAQARGAATRFVGARVRPEGAPDAYAGPFYDVYEVTEKLPLGDPATPRAKRYFFNSETQLLEAVRYEVEREGARVPVEVRVGGWRRVQGQQVPSTVVRLEAGRAVLSFNAGTAALSPRGANPNLTPGAGAF